MYIIFYSVNAKQKPRIVPSYTSENKLMCYMYNLVAAAFLGIAWNLSRLLSQCVIKGRTDRVMFLSERNLMFGDYQDKTGIPVP